MKTYSRLTLVLTFLLLPIASGILFTAPTFGDSLSGSETFDAQQFLSEAKAQQVAEAGKQGALIGFIVSLVIAYVMSPIDQQRWLKVVFVILGVTGGYFGSTFSAKFVVTGKVAFQLQSRMSRAAVKLAVLESDKEIMRMDRMGVDQMGLDKIVDNAIRLYTDKAIAVTPEDVAMIDEQLKRLVPALQKQLDAVIAVSDDFVDFQGKFGGAGEDIAKLIAKETGVPVKVIMSAAKKQLKAQALGKQIEKEITDSTRRQTEATQFAEAKAAEQRLKTGRTMTIGTGSSARVVGMSALDEDQMKRFSDPTEQNKLEKLRDASEREHKARTMPTNPGVMTKKEKKALDDAAKFEFDAIKRGDTGDIEKAKLQGSDAMRAYLDRVLGAENVTDTDVAAAMKATYDKDPTKFGKFVDSRRKSASKEGNLAATERRDLTKELTDTTKAGSLTSGQLNNLLANPQLFDALIKDINIYMKSMPKEKIEPVEDTKQVTPDSAQKPTAAEKIQSSNPQKRSNRRRRMKTR